MAGTDLLEPIERKFAFWQDEDIVSAYIGSSQQATSFIEQQFDAMLRVIAAFGTPTHRVLDLGCGDGITADIVAAAFPCEQITLVDFSAPMLELARNRFADSTIPVSIVEADLGIAGWSKQVAACDAPFDIVVSRYAIHHLPDARKRKLLREVFRLLGAGGLFINIEHVQSASAVYRSIFDDLVIESMIAASATPIEWDDAAVAYHDLYGSDPDILAAPEAQCDWLREAGFVDVDVVMRHFESAVLVGRKPAPR